MNNKLQLQQYDTEYLLQILAFFIVVFSSVSIVFFFLTYFKRIKKIKQLELKTEYQTILDRILFAYLFTDKGVTEEDSKLFKLIFATDDLFQKVAIKSIVSLQQNYAGEFQTKLQLFYVKFNIVNYSMLKLESKRWYKKVEGIRDLSNLKYQPAFEKIKSCLTHKHKLVQAEALLGILRMRGINELIQQKNTTLFLNDWIQSNIIFTIKTNKISEVRHLYEFLESDNQSMQLLGVRIIHHFHDAAYLKNLEALQNQTSVLKLKLEIQHTITHINNFYQKLT